MMKTAFGFILCLCGLALNLAVGAEEDKGQEVGETPLNEAGRENRNVEVAKLLISKGANVDLKDDAGKTPFDHAVEKHNTEGIEYFDKLP